MRKTPKDTKAADAETDPNQSGPGARSSFLASHHDLVIKAVIAVLVMAVYFQVHGFDFINLDDNLYVYENPAVLGGLNWLSINWAFAALYAANWHPLTWMSYQFDASVFGTGPGIFHSVNAFFHLINSILGFVVFRRITGREWESAAVAILFAVHPAHVESVAWIAERKDVLSTMFWLLTMWS
ncbi:MAG TPA: hypothetical protein VK468_05655, partial [Pyrinomonadaceae bacterium]|nr:hypothetical protein [Pyrinomonadaceae bacterium]